MKRPVDREAVAIAQLRAVGQRVTTPRRVVIKVLAAAGGAHVTAEEVFEQATTSGADIHLATVYRTLDRLGELGIVHHTHIGHGPAVFQLASEAHEHALCETCGAVVHVDRAVFAALERQLRREHGFRIGRQHFALTGTCQHCG